MSAEGFFSRIDEIVVNNNKMFSLRVGYFTTYEKAEMHKKRIYSRLGLSNLSIIKFYNVLKNTLDSISREVGK